jgi:hypothetical protein
MASTSKDAPTTPPPTYDQSMVKGAPSSSAAANASTPAPPTVAAPPPAGPAPPPAGPTPITSQGVHLLPVHDPRSPHAMREAISRARWRFVYAFLVAWGISLLFGGFTGFAAVDGLKA